MVSVLHPDDGRICGFMIMKVCGIRMCLMESLFGVLFPSKLRFRHSEKSRQFVLAIGVTGFAEEVGSSCGL